MRRNGLYFKNRRKLWLGFGVFIFSTAQIRSLMKRVHGWRPTVCFQKLALQPRTRTTRCKSPVGFYKFIFTVDELVVFLTPYFCTWRKGHTLLVFSPCVYVCVCPLPPGPVNLSTSAQLVAPAVVVKGTLSITASDLYFEVDEDEPGFKAIDPKVRDWSSIDHVSNCHLTQTKQQATSCSPLLFNGTLTNTTGGPSLCVVYRSLLF